MRGISAGDQDEPDVDIEVARAEVARAEAEMRVAEARLRLARADAQQARAADAPVDQAQEPDEADVVQDEEPLAAPDEPDNEPDGEPDGEEPDDEPAGVQLKVITQEAATERRRPSTRVLLAGLVVLLLLAGTAVAIAVRTNGPERANADLGKGIALRVGDVEVSEAALARRVQALKILYGLEVPTSGSDLATFRRETARSLATSIVIDDAARDEDIEVDAGDVSAALDRYVQSRYQGDQQAAFAAELAKNDISEKDVRDEIGRQLTGQQLFVKVTAGISVTDAEARSAYDADPQSWAQPEQRDLRYVAVADEVTARRVLAELRAGADFAEVARRESADTSTKDVGGALGLVTVDQLDPSFSKQAFAAAKGDLFGPVETGRGWYVGQVQSIVEPRTSFESLKDTIKDGLSSDQALKTWNAYVGRRSADATIEYAAAFRPSDDAPASEAPGPDLPSPAPSQPQPAPGQ